MIRWLFLFFACGPAPYDWQLPAGFPQPVVPTDNPMSNAKVQLGRHLFYDTRLSLNETQSCASCHAQERAFTDGHTTAIGSTGEAHPRHSMSLANVAYSSTLTWANPRLHTLEEQVLTPLFGVEPVELGMRGQEETLLGRLAGDPRYEHLLDDAFPGEKWSLALVAKALASFQRQLISGNSAYDRGALDAPAKRGEALFASEKFECFHCHVGFAFQDSVRYENKPATLALFHNTALYNPYVAPNRGVYELTQNPADLGRFRVPTLRNVSVTAPYMHDGSIATLSEVLDHYAAGGRTQNAQKGTFLVGFTLTDEERTDILAFLNSLTDEAFLTDPRHNSPWP